MQTLHRKVNCTNFLDQERISFINSLWSQIRILSHMEPICSIPREAKTATLPMPLLFQEGERYKVLWSWSCDAAHDSYEMDLSIPAGLIWMLVKNSLSSFLSWDKYLSQEGFIFIRWFSAINHSFNLKKELLIESQTVCIMVHKLQTPGWKNCD